MERTRKKCGLHAWYSINKRGHQYGNIFLTKIGILSVLLILALTLSACGLKQPTQAMTPVSPPESLQTDKVAESTNSAEADANKRTDRLDLQMPTLSEDELIGTYDPNDVCIRLDDLIYRLGIEIDESKDKYTYTAEDGDGKYREHTWDVQEGDEQLFNPPGIGNTYRVNRYDYNGKKVVVINMQQSNTGIKCTGMGVYEYKSDGEIKVQYNSLDNS